MHFWLLFLQDHLIVSSGQNFMFIVSSLLTFTYIWGGYPRRVVGRRLLAPMPVKGTTHILVMIHARTPQRRWCQHMSEWERRHLSAGMHAWTEYRLKDVSVLIQQLVGATHTHRVTGASSGRDTPPHETYTAHIRRRRQGTLTYGDKNKRNSGRESSPVCLLWRHHAGCRASPQPAPCTALPRAAATSPGYIPAGLRGEPRRGGWM